MMTALFFADAGFFYTVSADFTFYCFWLSVSFVYKSHLNGFYPLIRIMP